jgi:excinuclease ABC subunit C
VSVSRRNRPTLPAELRRKPEHAPISVRRELRERVRETAENRPAVYRMLSEGGTVLYVGKSKSLRSRLLSYFRAKGRRDKQAKILRHAHAIEWEYVASEFAALLGELRLIKRHRPRFNAAMNQESAPRAYIVLTRGAEPAVRVVFRSDEPDAEVMYGPFRRAYALADAARALTEATGVRDCAGSQAGGGARGACLRRELGACACGQPDYAARAAEARAFLAGETVRPIATLRAMMTEAANQLRFERAGALKLRVEALEWLTERLARFHAGVDRLTFRYPVAGVGPGEDRVYLIRRGTVRADLPMPATEADRVALELAARRIYEAPDRSGADVPLHDLDELYLVTSWFRRRPAELARTEPCTPAAP